jgi:hypothetical protein
VEQVANDPDNGLAVFVQGVPRIIRAGWAVALIGPGDKPRRIAASSAAPETRAVHLPWWPLAKATIMDGEESWVPEPWRELGTELAASPLGGSERALLVGRPGGPMFRAAEVARLAHLAGIVAAVLAEHGGGAERAVS